MNRTHRIHFIQSIAAQTYQDAFHRLEEALKDISLDDLREELLDCGTIPEFFTHDSSEEKLWAKYCDMLLSHTLNRLKIQTTVIRTRGDSADLLGVGDGYTLVADAKAFRLSRSAKNQKDFKVSALDDWRKTNTYACLVAPLYQYPAHQSQIYLQAKVKNVTLLSYIHVRFLLDYPPQESLESLWQISRSVPATKEARLYWEKVDTLVAGLASQPLSILQAHKKLEILRTVEIGQESIRYWHAVMAHYQTLSREEAIKQLIKAEKIDQKIRVIEDTLTKVSKVYD